MSPDEEIETTLPDPLNAVVVTTKQAVVIRGALKRRAADGLVLVHASISNRDANGVLFWTPLDGDVVIPLEGVEFYQSALDASVLET